MSDQSINNFAKWANANASKADLVGVRSCVFYWDRNRMLAGFRSRKWDNLSNFENLVDKVLATTLLKPKSQYTYALRMARVLRQYRATLTTSTSYKFIQMKPKTLYSTHRPPSDINVKGKKTRITSKATLTGLVQMLLRNKSARKIIVTELKKI